MDRIKNTFIIIVYLVSVIAFCIPVFGETNEQEQLERLADPQGNYDQQRPQRQFEDSDSVDGQQQEEQVDDADSSPSKNTFDYAADSIGQQLKDSLAELSTLREQMAEEKIPLSRKLSELESELVNIRREYQNTTRLLDSRTLDLSNLRTEIKTRREEAGYLSNLLSEYARNFESRLHIAEIQRYHDELETAKLAPENSNLSDQQVYQAQAQLISVSLERLHEALGGTRFQGTAVDSSGLVKSGTFILLGPAALFLSDDGQSVGLADQRLGSLEPTIIPFNDPENSIAASEVVSRMTGSFPLDPSLGNAHKIEETKESLLEHIQKGGLVMYPIFTLAGAALLVAVFKLVCLMCVQTPSRKRINELLDALVKHDKEGIHQKVKMIKGPIGKMLSSAVEHIKEPIELVEEVMYEKVLSTRLKLERFLPFIAITAASAPLLGLLGTVTGIINTFKLITVFGSGDVKTLSGGISEALITTEFGLIVAIPSLLLHAFLSRKARGIINQMEKAAVTFVNQLSKTPFQQKKDKKGGGVTLTPEQYQGLVRTIMGQKRPQIQRQKTIKRYSDDTVGAMMNPRMVTVNKYTTVGETINKIRISGIGREIDSVFIVDEQGKYLGYALVRHLLVQPEQSQIESLVETKPLYVHVDSHKNEAHKLFRIHEIMNLPVVDKNGQLVGRIVRNGNGDG